MTTIAFDGNTVAADSRAMNCGWIAHENSNKLRMGIHPKFGPAIFGVSGDAVEAIAALEYMLQGKSFTGKGEGYTIIGVFNKKTVRLWCDGENHLEGELIEQRFYAIGSGGIAAKAAMMAGATAKQAVKIASRLDPGTGGKIRLITLKDLWLSYSSKLI